MEKLNSDIATIGNKKFQIIYLSVDQNSANWQSVIYTFLNKSNSFRITGTENEFIKDFMIRIIPRYVLLNNAALISSDFKF